MQLALLFLMLLQPTQLFPLPFFFSYFIYIPLHRPYQSIAAINPGAGDKQNKPGRGEEMGPSKAGSAGARARKDVRHAGFPAREETARCPAYSV